jgi:hypothetical protein
MSSNSGSAKRWRPYFFQMAEKPVHALTRAAGGRESQVAGESKGGSPRRDRNFRH